MKLKSFYEKRLKRALDHWDEHPISGSARMAYKEAKWVLEDYLHRVEEYESKRSNSNTTKS